MYLERPHELNEGLKLYNKLIVVVEMLFYFSSNEIKIAFCGYLKF